MTPADLALIKNAQNQLITLCGGIDAAKLISGYGRSTVGRWADVGDPTIMPTPAKIRLQKHCKLPLVTSAEALIFGRRLSDPVEEDSSEKCLMTVLAGIFAGKGELSSYFAIAIADGVLSANELTGLDRLVAELVRGAEEYQKASAAAKAKGGLKLARAG
ncbi:hypothetical protein [Tianweitania sediminis]|uniref:Phage protein n=1 Tax=Tianweitania sediminis TaxID=1502156 RepID=A0A8J7UJ42_9HYPH|nr:hypothetical protein [Tianweitania sediminis]MBP0439608.1 hypothetical protein [Tianweitania sediminis]